MQLEDYGFGAFFADAFSALNDARLSPGRIVWWTSGWCRLAAERGDLSARLAGGLIAAGAAPAVGDWVAFDPETARVHHLLPRRTKLSRKVAGKRTEEQVVAANVDVVFVVVGLDLDFNPRRVERFLTTVWESGASPVVILNKADLCSEVAVRRVAIEKVSPGAEILVVSAVEGRGLSEVRALLPRGRTGVLVGSSGVGKSTLVNALLGEDARATREVRAGDDRGRHTTTDRALFRIPGGGLLVDGPGIREIQLWAGASSLERSFEDVARLANGCRFRDCAHRGEPGCAVTEAVTRGELSEERLASFRSLQKELRYLEARRDESKRRVEKSKWRAIHKEMRRSGKHRRT